ncbi:MAG TPA: FAD-dependent oxidoreductase [Candidatus Sulfotelmatobacter sp.]|nr:FAD-dependent oxidoreductase [Candidatus Sulfotelmatobacter sp.]
MSLLTPDICVVGGGSGGLSVAAGAAQMGADTVLVERAKMGGDCLNYGCVPSKSLLAAAKAAHHVHEAARFGIEAGPPRVDYAAVQRHVRGVIEAIAPTDSVERFEGLGVRVIRDQARFRNAREIEAGGTIIRARRFVLATGSHPAVPPIPGLADVPYLTNESIFDLAGLPEHLIVLGGGPIGVEMAQAHRLLGSRVSLVEAVSLLGKDDPELVDVVRRRLKADGIALHEATKATAVARAPGDAIAVEAGDGTTATRLVGSHLLVATGRVPTIDGLELDKAGIAHTRAGITVDARLRTTNRRVFAIGDVAGALQFTHVAGYHAGVVIRNALFRQPARASHATIPWVTYGDPELAQVGLTEAQARAATNDELRILRWSLAENDRARAEGGPAGGFDGALKAVVTRRGRLLGCGIVSRQAGELIQPWVLAMSAGLGIRALATMVAPYPTLGEISKRAAGSFYVPTLFSKRTRRLVRLLRLFG